MTEDISSLSTAELLERIIAHTNRRWAEDADRKDYEKWQRRNRLNKIVEIAKAAHG